ncbi:hypothetical protein [Pseudomonas mandelii]|uniref:hypothetical protein n=1 Tax=Pseudomonas mandelii TaxID=75612 RepID=UPI00209DE321|nr:hypothetical protein [Pseudomonas mandelii]MCO8310704.1 hypothetical protein [Pseudomonas mandelii]
MSALMKKLKKPTEIKLSLQAFNAFFRLFSGVLRIETPARKNIFWSLDHAERVWGTIGRIASGNGYYPTATRW